MAIFDHNWYALNAARPYPVDDSATLRDDSGQVLPYDLLVDCQLRLPSTLGRFVFLSSAVVTPTLVSLTFLATQHAPVEDGCESLALPADEFTPVAAISLPRARLEAHRHYPVEAFAAGVGGWVVLGPGIDQPYRGRFSTSQQALLCPRSARWYNPLPIPSFGKLGVHPGLEGVVRLVAGSDVEIAAETKLVGGASRQCIVLRLKDDQNRNVYATYVGPCDLRPESGNCARPPIETINGLRPDCDGNIDIVFRGDLEVRPYDVGSAGLIVEHELGLIDICAQPLESENPADEACFESNFLEGEPEGGEEAEIPDPPESEHSESGDTGYLLPYYENFDRELAEGFQTISGEFAFEPGDAPEEPSAGYDASSSLSSLSAGWFPNVSYASRNYSKRNVAVMSANYFDSNINLKAATDLKLLSTSPHQNGGLVFNYRRVGSTDFYWVAELDKPSDSLRIRYWQGVTFDRFIKVGHCCHPSP